MKEINDQTSYSTSFTFAELLVDEYEDTFWMNRFKCLFPFLFNQTVEEVAAESRRNRENLHSLVWGFKQDTEVL